MGGARPDRACRSARRAEAEFTGLGVTSALVAEVARLVRLTAAHDPLAGDRNGGLCTLIQQIGSPPRD